MVACITKIGRVSQATTFLYIFCQNRLDALSRSSSRSSSLCTKQKHRLRREKRQIYFPLNTRCLSNKSLDTLPCCSQSDALSDQNSDYSKSIPLFMRPENDDRGKTLASTSFEKKNFVPKIEQQLLENKNLLGLGDYRWQKTNPVAKKNVGRTTRSGKIYCSFE